MTAVSENPVAKQTSLVKQDGGAPHADKKLKHEGHGPIQFILIDSKVQPRSEKADQQSFGLRPLIRSKLG